MASAAAPPIRVASRRARALLLKRRGDGSPVPKSAPKTDDTPWPQNLRYAFYAACVISVPLSAAQAIAMSPRLREELLGDDMEEEEGGGSGSGGSSGVSSQQIISWVRHYWGVEEYVPPVDRPQSKHVAPGHRHEWQEDNRSSFLHLLGLYAPKETAPSDIAGSTEGGENAAPISLESEANSRVREEQRILSRYLSAKTNPSGVKTRLTLLPLSAAKDGDGEPGYENECTLPGSLSVRKLRESCKGSMAQVVKRELAESDPDFRSRSTEETLRTRRWNEECRWAVGFAASDDGGGDRISSGGIGSDGGVGDTGGLGDGDEGGAFPEAFGSGVDGAPAAANELRRDTSIFSSWTSFNDLAGNNGVASQGLDPANSPVGSAGASGAASAEALREQGLDYNIAALTKELNDPTSLRDRDVVREELRVAQEELRGLRPWWRRFW